MKDIRIGNIGFIYTDKSFGNMSSEVGDTNKYIENRLNLLRQLPPNKRNVCIKSLHTNKVIDIETTKCDTLTEPNIEVYKCDAIFINTDKTNGWLFPADCIPLVFYADNDTSCMLVHVSRKTITTSLLQDSMEKFMQLTGVDTPSIKVYAGPHISKDGYLFPDKIAGKLFDASWAKYLTKTDDDKIQVDLIGRTTNELARLGLDPSQITIDPRDTGDGRYFSNSAGHKNSSLLGRNAVVVFKP